MNKVERVDFVEFEDAPTMVYITCHTDGDPSELFWCWEISLAELIYHFRDNEDMTDRLDREDVLPDDEEIIDFVNDESLLKDSDYYEGGKEPIYGVWYAPLTMEQIERSFL